MPMQSPKERAPVVSLVDAAARARVRYARMLDHVLCGDVRGLRENGRWYVDAEDLERFLRERAPTRPVAA